MNVRNSFPLACGLLIGCAVFFYAPVLGGYFVHDDLIQVHVLGTVFRWSDFWTHSHDGVNYRPLFAALYRVDHVFWGVNSFGYHLTTLVLHLFNSMLIFFLSRRLAYGAGPSIRHVLPAVLFCFHPLCVEVVSYPAARHASLGMFFMLCALLSFLRCREKPAVFSCCAVLVSSAAALLSSEMSFLLPLYFLIADCACVRNPAGSTRWAGRRCTYILVAAVVVLFLVQRRLVLGTCMGHWQVYLRNSLSPSEFLQEMMIFLVPLNAEMVPANVATLIRFLWGALLVFLVIHVCRTKKRGLALPLVCLGASLMPLMMFRSLYANLSGARMWYVPAVWGSVALGIVLWEDRPGRGWILFLSLFLAVWLSMTRVNLDPWLHAHRMTRTIQQEILSLPKTCQNIQLEHIPDFYRGAFVYFHPESLEMAVSPPFVTSARKVTRCHSGSGCLPVEGTCSFSWDGTRLVPAQYHESNER